MLAIALTGLIAIWFVPTVGAQRNAPPGNSQIDQYVETVPDPRGDRQAGPGAGGGGSGGPSAGIPAGTVAQLEQLGEEGRAAVEAANATAPKGASGRPRSGGDGVAGVAAQRGEGSGLRAVVEALSGTDGGGSGPLVPLLLAAVTVLGLAFVILRKRASQA